MLRIVSFLMILINFSFAEDFMSHFEYGQMLYNNPRGVSCALCHGDKGQGGVIAKYKENNNSIITIKGSDITNISLKDMKTSLNATHQIMPKYYLTDKEIKAIYDFIQKINKN